MAPQSSPRGWGGALFIQQHINHIKAIASMDVECLVMPHLGPPGQSRLGSAKPCLEPRGTRASDIAGGCAARLENLCPRVAGTAPCRQPEVTTYHGREGGPARASESQCYSGVSAWRETRKPQGIVSQVSADTGPQSVGEGPGQLRPDIPLFGAGYSQKNGCRETGAR